MVSYSKLKISFLVFEVLLLPALSRAEMPYTEDFVQGHRCLVVQPAGLPDNAPVVVVLHGFGSSGDVSYGVFTTELDLPPCLLVFPDGPLDIPHSSHAKHAWYDRATHSYQDMKNSRDYLLAVMDHFSKEYFPSDSDDASQPLVRRSLGEAGRPVIILGESQGGLMSLEAGLHYKGKLAAIISICGFIEYPSKTLARPQAPKSTPILMVNGKWDPVVLEEDVFTTVKALKKAGYRPTLKEFPIGHKINRQMFMEVSNFIQQVLSGSVKKP